METPLNVVSGTLKVSYWVLGFPLRIVEDKAKRVVTKGHWFDSITRPLIYLSIVGFLAYFQYGKQSPFLSKALD